MTMLDKRSNTADSWEIRATVEETMTLSYFHLLPGDIVWVVAYVRPSDSNIKSGALNSVRAYLHYLRTARTLHASLVHRNISYKSLGIALRFRLVACLKIPALGKGIEYHLHSVGYHLSVALSFNAFNDFV